VERTLGTNENENKFKERSPFSVYEIRHKIIISASAVRDEGRYRLRAKTPKAIDATNRLENRDYSFNMRTITTTRFREFSIDGYIFFHAKASKTFARINKLSDTLVRLGCFRGHTYNNDNGRVVVDVNILFALRKPPE